MDEYTSLLEVVGPQLKEYRSRASLTLAQASELTAISSSTISRLESGGRKPTLELLLPLASAYDVALDELVRAPKVRDPRVQQKPFVKDGMTFVPLTRDSGGLHAYKMILPGHTGAKKLEQRVHDGYEWMYVLRGRLRLALGDREIILAAGEVAEFDTRVPHACASAGAAAVEILSLFGSQGERIHVRARMPR
jgi:transcriptional regulator with XRE-family HTH domain